MCLHVFFFNAFLRLHRDGKSKSQLAEVYLGKANGAFNDLTRFVKVGLVQALPENIAQAESAGAHAICAMIGAHATCAKIDIGVYAKIAGVIAGV